MAGAIALLVDRQRAPVERLRLAQTIGGHPIPLVLWMSRCSILRRKPDGNHRPDNKRPNRASYTLWRHCADWSGASPAAPPVYNATSDPLLTFLPVFGSYSTMQPVGLQRCSNVPFPLIT